jgi:hypothetical protein
MIENAINILSDVDVQSSFIEKWREHLQIIKERNNVNKG